MLKIINSYFNNDPTDVNYVCIDNIVSDFCNNFTEAYQRYAKVILEVNSLNFDFKRPEDTRRMINQVVSKSYFYESMKLNKL